MNLIIWLQGLATGFLTILATVFDFFGQLPFFVLLFGLMFLLYNKDFSFKFFLTYVFGFMFGSLLLKNVVNRVRPYNANHSLLAERASYSGSLPSATTILATENSMAIYTSNKNRLTKKMKVFCIIMLSILVLCNCFSQLYFAKNYLFDVLLGVVIGFVIFVLIFKFLNLKSGYQKWFFIIGFPVSIILLLCYSSQLFTNNFSSSAVIEFCGIVSAILLGFYLEEKYVKYQIKNNLIYTSFKIFTILIVLIGYYFVCKFLPGILIFSFVKYFAVGLIVTLFLPWLFKRVERYFYIFSNKVNKDNVKFSKISLCEKGTSKIAKQIYNSLKPGDLVLLEGDLGAGKSVVVRNILQYFGVTKKITSPTFTLVNEYKTNKNHFYHFDMYRIEEEEEVINIGFDEIINDENAIKFIEWPEKVLNFLPKKCKRIVVVKLGKTSRNIIFEEN